MSPLSPSPSRLIGRERELATLARLAPDVRVVTLVGPAGVGKSRLAREHASLYDGPVVLVELEDARDLPDMCFRMRRGLGAEATPPTDTQSRRIGELLAARDACLVVLDGLEHLVAHADATIGLWARLAPQARFLLTSRTRLGLDGEHVVELAPLSLPSSAADLEGSESFALLADRARAAGRELALDEPERLPLLALVRALDGLPLAIELAAARLRLVDPGTLAARLATHRLETLARAGDARARHATLRGALRSSWDLLAHDERSALAQCTIFAGGFDLAAAEGVLRTATPVIDALQSLRDHSLLALCGARFAMLDAVRELARELADPAELEAAELRHAAYYLALAERAPVDRAREADNLLAAHRRAASPRAIVLSALALEPLLELRGPGAIPSSVLDRAVEAAVGLEPALRVRVLAARADARRWAGCLEEAASDLELARSIAGDPASRAHAEQRTGHLAVSRGRLDDAAGAYARSLAAAREAGDPALEARALYGGALVDHQRDRLEEAEGGYAQARRLAALQKDARLEGFCVASLAILRLPLGDAEGALLLTEAALALHRACGDRRTEANTLSNLACLELARGRAEHARALLEQAVRMHREHANVRYEAFALGYLALVRSELGDARGAQDALACAVEIQARLANARERGLLAAYEGVLLARQGELARSADAFERARAWLEGLGGYADAARAHEGHLDLARARAARDEHDEADRWISSARARVGEAPFRAAEAYVAARLLARTLEDLEPERAALCVAPDGRWFRAPGGRRVDLGARPVLARVLAALWRCRVEQPGRALSTGELIAAGWPDERILPRAAAARVHAAIAALRRAGLKRVLVRRSGGYVLDASVTRTRFVAIVI